MTRENTDRFEYDVALSFADQNRDIAEEFASSLQAKNIKIFLDESPATEPGDFVIHLAELYRTKAHYCVMFISRQYPLKMWTEAERTSVQQHALRDAEEYIIPIQLDDTEVPGIRETRGYRDLREDSVGSIVNWLEQKLTATRDRSGPPSESHDLRSGNIPSTQDKS